jgi:predicted RNA-binding Zn ribbon-like protein
MVVTQSPPAGGCTMAKIGQAPGDLRTVQAFVNTLDIEQGTDELTAPAALDDWLEAAGLTEPSVPTRSSAADLTAALELREALRGVLGSHVRHETPGQPVDGAAGQLASIAATMAARLQVDAAGRITLVPAGAGSRAALTRLLLIAAGAAMTGTWPRLKVCSADDCRWAFYDRSPTRTGCWCSMSVCGSRAKSRAYRDRAARVR